MRVECANEELETSVEHSRRSAYPSRETEPGVAKMDCHGAGPRPNPFAAPGPDLRTTEVGSQGGARASGSAGYAEPPFQHGAPQREASALQRGLGGYAAQRHRPWILRSAIF